ncbi:hypothetical protein MGYG_07645 [Nannizzia gypsea CBS 118893]|uniref:Uncharacterized protein n=1 Tax=Arthroderma gypseum (strain ATCC MYA-4604 / CBS 118893) TaxID=535722 RepID=E4V3R5_ARTGP|nr:hypothetical protein MGYG_07645 [Nannizzia gypsea CBS 118893]EFR04639.1 hypothetical protein MGYG_07645 [Nannizzia gypsea CBS 118893]
MVFGTLAMPSLITAFGSRKRPAIFQIVQATISRPLFESNVYTELLRHYYHQGGPWIVYPSSPSPSSIDWPLLVHALHAKEEEEKKTTDSTS